MKSIKRVFVALSVLLVSGAFAVVMAGHKEPMSQEGSTIPVKIVQGILKAVDPLNHTITMDMGAMEYEAGQIVEHQMTTLRVSNEAFEQIHRVGKKGERLELRLSSDDVVEAVAVGTGP